MGLCFGEVAVKGFVVKSLGGEIFNGVSYGLVVVRRRCKGGKFLNVGSECGPETVFGGIGAGFGNGNKGFL